jgi:hypothetical protein
VLGKLPDWREAQEVIRERREVLNGDHEDALTVREFFVKKIREAGYEPEFDVLRIATAKAGEWYREATNSKTMKAGESTSALRGAGITELTYDPKDPKYRFEHGRFWIWRSMHAPTDKDPPPGQIIE